jgi:hypothetical protein
MKTNRFDIPNLFSQPRPPFKSVSRARNATSKSRAGIQAKRFCVHSLAVLSGACQVILPLDQASDSVVHQHVDFAANTANTMAASSCAILPIHKQEIAWALAKFCEFSR